MGRIPPDRPGYAWYTCIGIATHVIPVIDCAGPNHYRKLPIIVRGGVSDRAWENASPIDDDPRLRGYATSCGLDFDPFSGVQVDLYQAFLDDGLGGLIEDGCTDEYTTGFTNPTRSIDLRGCKQLY